VATIAYVDHSFHQTTKSTDFLPQILRRHGHTVDYFWDEAWRGRAHVAWDSVASYDVVIMFQSYCPPPQSGFRRAHPNVIYIPMLDQFGQYQGPLFNLTSFWEPFQGSKVLNFSNALHSLTVGFGIVSHFARYYQPSVDYPEPPVKGLHGFFWLRRESELPWRVVRNLIANAQFDSFHLHMATDPGTPRAQLPSAQDIERHNITTSTWFEDKDDLNAQIGRANVFFAPRLEEGIGQSFLEAMARGQCVVAANHGTMNEYILPSVNGLLYDIKNPAPLDFSEIGELGRQAKKSAVIGRKRWENAEGDLVQFILTPSMDLYANRYQHPVANIAGSGQVAALSPVLAPGSALRRKLGRYPVLRAVWQKVRNMRAKLGRSHANVKGSK